MFFESLYTVASIKKEIRMIKKGGMDGKNRKKHFIESI